MTELDIYYAANIMQRPKSTIAGFFEDGEGNTLEAYKDKTVESSYFKKEKPVESESGPIAEVKSCRKFLAKEQVIQAIENSDSLEELREEVESCD